MKGGGDDDSFWSKFFPLSNLNMTKKIKFTYNISTNKSITIIGYLGVKSVKYLRSENSISILIYEEWINQSNPPIEFYKPSYYDAEESKSKSILFWNTLEYELVTNNTNIIAKQNSNKNTIYLTKINELIQLQETELGNNNKKIEFTYINSQNEETKISGYLGIKFIKFQNIKYPISILIYNNISNKSPIEFYKPSYKNNSISFWDTLQTKIIDKNTTANNQNTSTNNQNNEAENDFTFKYTQLNFPKINKENMSVIEKLKELIKQGGNYRKFTFLHKPMYGNQVKKTIYGRFYPIFKRNNLQTIYNNTEDMMIHISKMVKNINDSIDNLIIIGGIILPFKKNQDFADYTYTDLEFVREYRLNPIDQFIIPSKYWIVELGKENSKFFYSSVQIEKLTQKVKTKYILNLPRAKKLFPELRTDANK